ncbi:hypothetical protein HMPREF2627_10445 [Staphylococcus sp. HMSC061F10]|nr:hypothetical protein HMPREF2720_04395 [Staphylococcus sp. HMSC074C02]OHP56030.1 hypothetical protein HMPREF2627_10445 [Staphylococcus sp. HMSC061F10]
MIKLKMHLSQAFFYFSPLFWGRQIQNEFYLTFLVCMVYIHKQYDKISDHNELDTFVVITYFSNVPGLKISFHSLNGQYLQTTLSTIFYQQDQPHQIGYLYYYK